MLEMGQELAQYLYESRDYNCPAAHWSPIYLRIPHHPTRARLVFNRCKVQVQNQKKVRMSKSVDYSLYLVTDSTPAILGDASLVDVVEAALEGGVTIVQYRDKSTETGVMVDTARRLHAVTKKYNVPLLINDRVDVALAVGCEGVHIGQDDIGESIFHMKPDLWLITT